MGPPERGEYQVWHDRGWPQSRIDQMLGGWPPSQFPQDYFHAADVQADSVLEAVQLTTGNGHVLKGDHQRWDDHQGVRSHTPKTFVPRDTDKGDVIVDPQGKAHRYDGPGFREVEAAARQPLPFPSPGAIADEGEHQLDLATTGGTGQGEAEHVRLPSPGEIAEGRDGSEMPGPERGPDKGRGR